MYSVFKDPFSSHPKRRNKNTFLPAFCVKKKCAFVCPLAWKIDFFESAFSLKKNPLLSFRTSPSIRHVFYPVKFFNRDPFPPPLLQQEQNSLYCAAAPFLEKAMRRIVNPETVVIVSDGSKKMTVRINRKNGFVAIDAKETNIPYILHLPDITDTLLCESKARLFDGKEIRCGLLFKEGEVIGFCGISST